MNNTKSENKMTFGFLFLLAYLFLVYVRFYELPVFHFLIPIQPTRIFMILTLILSFLAREWRGDILKNLAVKWFIMIPVLALLLLPFSVWKARSLDHFQSTDIKIIITFFVLLVFLSSDYRILRVNRAIFLSVVCVALRVFFAYRAGSYTIDAGGVQRVVGVGTLGSDDPNDMALVLAMAVPLGLYYWHTRRALKKWLAGLCVCLMMAALVVTGSRGGYLGIAAGLIVFYGFLYRKKKFKYIVVMACLALLAAVFTPSQYKARFVSMFDESDYTHTDERHGRVAVWKRSWKAMLNRPIGYGRGNTTIAEGQEKAAEGMPGKWMVTHNSYLQIGLELGFLGLFCYVMFLVSGFVNIKKILGLCRGPDQRHYEVMACALAGGLGAFLVSSFFLSQAYYWNQYIFIALTVGLRRMVEQKDKGLGIKDEGKGDQKQAGQRKWKSRAVSGQLEKK